MVRTVHNYEFYVPLHHDWFLDTFHAPAESQVWGWASGIQRWRRQQSPPKELTVKNASILMTKIPAIILSPCMEEAQGSWEQACQEHPSLSAHAVNQAD